MRAIKFRGKNTVTGEWEYGYFWKDDICGDCYIREGNGVDHRVDPDTVSQLVCIVDSTEIYEGDYIQDENDDIWLVEYDDISHEFLTVFQGSAIEVGENSEWLCDCCISVIGNRWNNKLEDFYDKEGKE